MGRKYLGTILLIIVLPLTIICKEDRKTHRHFRTDGFYLYDNGIDSIAIIPGGRKMQLEMLHTMRASGFDIPADTAFSSLDSEAKNTEGTTSIRFLAFFSDTSGMLWGTIFRTDSVLKNFMEIYNRRKATKDRTDKFKLGSMQSITFLNDSVFTFKKGVEGNYFEQFNTGIFRHDTLHLSGTRPIAPGVIVNDINYIFHPIQQYTSRSI